MHVSGEGRNDIIRSPKTHAPSAFNSALASYTKEKCSYAPEKIACVARTRLKRARVVYNGVRERSQSREEKCACVRACVQCLLSQARLNGVLAELLLPRLLKASSTSSGNTFFWSKLCTQLFKRTLYHSFYVRLFIQLSTQATFAVGNKVSPHTTPGQEVTVCPSFENTMS